MSGFVFHPDAVSDLEEIWEYIAAESPPAADRVVAEVHEMIQRLVSFPQLGHNRPDLTSRPLRFHAVRDFLIAYAPDEKPLIVVAVLHGQRSEEGKPLEPQMNTDKR